MDFLPIHGSWLKFLAGVALVVACCVGGGHIVLNFNHLPCSGLNKADGEGSYTTMGVGELLPAMADGFVPQGAAVLHPCLDGPAARRRRVTLLQRHQIPQHPQHLCTDPMTRDLQCAAVVVQLHIQDRAETPISPNSFASKASRWGTQASWWGPVAVVWGPLLNRVWSDLISCAVDTLFVAQFCRFPSPRRKISSPRKNVAGQQFTGKQHGLHASGRGVSADIMQPPIRQLSSLTRKQLLRRRLDDAAIPLASTSSSIFFARRRQRMDLSVVGVHFLIGSVGPPSTVALRGLHRRARLRHRRCCGCSSLSGRWTTMYFSLLWRTFM